MLPLPLPIDLNAGRPAPPNPPNVACFGAGLALAGAALAFFAGARPVEEEDEATEPADEAAEELASEKAAPAGGGEGEGQHAIRACAVLGRERGRTVIVAAGARAREVVVVLALDRALDLDAGLLARRLALDGGLGLGRG